MHRGIKESQRVIARRRRGDERLLAALASGLTIPEAAKEAGLSARTAHRRMANPLFRAELDEYRREVVRRASAWLETAVGSAVATLEALMADRDPWVSLRAASAILSAAVQLKDIQVLEERLMSLEEQARELPLAGVPASKPRTHAPRPRADRAAVVRCPESSKGTGVGLLSRFFSRAPVVEVSYAPPRYSGDETLEVVGESFHQDVLWKLVGGRTHEPVRCAIRAILEPEPDNPEDRNAIMILIQGECVGRLSRHDAAAYLPGVHRLGANGPVELAGMIVGGGRRRDGIGFLGVFLDHDPRDFGIPQTGYRYGPGDMRTGFSEAVVSDVEDDSYDLSWHAELSDDHAEAVRQLRLMLEAERDPIDRHYMLSELTKRLYKSREPDPTALDAFDAACEEHHAEMVTIRTALFEKFGVVPVIETYRQAVIRCQKAKDWSRMREWAERGIAIYGDDAGRPEVVDDLQKRLAYAMAKIEAPASPKRRRTTVPVTPTAPVVEALVCTRCGATFERVRTRGRKPHLCPDCRGV